MKNMDIMAILIFRRALCYGISAHSFSRMRTRSLGCAGTFVASRFRFLVRLCSFRLMAHDVVNGKKYI
jgi:hypothetical protein